MESKSIHVILTITIISLIANPIETLFLQDRHITAPIKDFIVSSPYINETFTEGSYGLPSTDSKIIDIKKAASYGANLFWDKMKLLHDGKELADDDRKFTSYNIDAGENDTVYLKVEGKDWWIVNVQVKSMKSNKIHKLTMNRYNEVLDLKKRLEILEKIPIAKQKLTQNSFKLPDHLIFDVLGIKNNTQLELNETSEINNYQKHIPYRYYRLMSDVEQDVQCFFTNTSRQEYLVPTKEYSETNVLVHCPLSGNKHNITINSLDSIRKIQEKLETLEKMPASEQVLKVGQYHLNMSLKIWDLEIKNGTVLTLSNIFDD